MTKKKKRARYWVLRRTDIEAWWYRFVEPGVVLSTYVKFCARRYRTKREAARHAESAAVTNFIPEAVR